MLIEEGLPKSVTLVFSAFYFDSHLCLQGVVKKKVGFF